MKSYTTNPDEMIYNFENAPKISLEEKHRRIRLMDIETGELLKKIHKLNKTPADHQPAGV
jgi:hypothetical protein